MRFAYLPWLVSQPVFPLGGARLRHYPVFNIQIGNTSGALVRDGLLDSGADDTIFPSMVAQQLGIDLSHAPVGRARQAGGAALLYRYAGVTLRISDGRETCQWQAIVGFADCFMRWPLLGQTGFLQFFDAELCGARREVVLTPNAAFSGTHTIH